MFVTTKVMLVAAPAGDKTPPEVHPGTVCRVLMERKLSQYPGLKEFCQKLYDQSHRSPHLLACMVDTYEEMLEMGCENSEEVLQKALQVGTRLPQH